MCMNLNRWSFFLLPMQNSIVVNPQGITKVNTMNRWFKSQQILSDLIHLSKLGFLHPLGAKLEKDPYFNPNCPESPTPGSLSQLADEEIT